MMSPRLHESNSELRIELPEPEQRERLIILARRLLSTSLADSCSVEERFTAIRHLKRCWDCLYAAESNIRLGVLRSFSMRV